MIPEVFSGNRGSSAVNHLFSALMMATISSELQKNERAIRLPETQAERNQFRVDAIKAKEGSRLTSHSQYKTNPRHSYKPEIYIPARSSYLNFIKANAAMDRHDNPAWHRAQNIIYTISN